MSTEKNIIGFEYNENEYLAYFYKSFLVNIVHVHEYCNRLKFLHIKKHVYNVWMRGAVFVFYALKQCLGGI